MVKGHVCSGGNRTPARDVLYLVCFELGETETKKTIEKVVEKKGHNQKLPFLIDACVDKDAFSPHTHHVAHGQYLVLQLGVRTCME